MGEYPDHVTSVRESVEISCEGQKTVLHVTTRLPVTVGAEGFNAEDLHDFVADLSERFMRSGAYDRIVVISDKSNA